MLSRLLPGICLALSALAIPVWVDITDGASYQHLLPSEIPSPRCGPYDEGVYNITAVSDDHSAPEVYVSAPKKNGWVEQGVSSKNSQWRLVPSFDRASYSFENVGLSHKKKSPLYAQLSRLESVDASRLGEWAIRAQKVEGHPPSLWKIQETEEGDCTINHYVEPCVWGPLTSLGKGQHIGCHPDPPGTHAQRYSITPLFHSYDEPEEEVDDIEVATAGILTALRLRILASILGQVERLGAF